MNFNDQRTVKEKDKEHKDEGLNGLKISVVHCLSL